MPVRAILTSHPIVVTLSPVVQRAAKLTRRAHRAYSSCTGPEPSFGRLPIAKQPQHITASVSSCHKAGC
jgi:hypothetical protein